ncbi:MAG: hypothetical protein Q4E65_02500 [Clostridia bacterium]|nr:hypothetical protein [Clostridia bacterium]
MLSKLMKYDFRDQGRLQWPLQLGVLLGGILAGFCMSYFVRTAQMMGDQQQGPHTMQIVMVVIISLVMILIAASSIITQILVGKQYYQNCFCDEGYLTFTLPVASSKVLLSKVITGSIWILINLLAVLIGVGLFLLIGFGFDAKISAEIAQGFAELKAEFAQFSTGFDLTWFIIQYVALTLISAVASVVMVDFVVTLGNQLARKHKILCAVCLYFLVTFIISAVSGVISSAMMLTVMSAGEVDWNVYFSAMNGVFTFTLVMSVVITAVMYYITDRMLKNKLNLE